MSIVKLNKKVTGPGLHLITSEVQEKLNYFLQNPNVATSGFIYLFCMHTSCALTINEAWDPSAREDLESFLDHLAPENLSFITHTIEGADDSPAHMKSALLQPHLMLAVEKGELIIGRWQGIYLAEFRQNPPQRTLVCKYIPDSIST